MATEKIIAKILQKLVPLILVDAYTAMCQAL